MAIKKTIKKSFKSVAKYSTKLSYKEKMLKREKRKIKVQKVNFYDVIKYPVYTEKTSQKISNSEDSKSGSTYTFIVDVNSTKPTIKAAIEKIYSVGVASVNVINMKPKAAKRGKYTGFKAAYKKAYVTLKADSGELKI